MSSIRLVNRFVWNHQYFENIAPENFPIVMYIAPSSGHVLLNLNLPFKLILRRFRLFSDIWSAALSENAALFKRPMEIHSNPLILYNGFKLNFDAKYSQFLDFLPNHVSWLILPLSCVQTDSLGMSVWYQCGNIFKPMYGKSLNAKLPFRDVHCRISIFQVKKPLHVNHKILKDISSEGEK